MKRISLEKLLNQHKYLSYQEQYELVLRQIQDSRIKPVKASGTNGKSPSLYREYWVLEEAKDYTLLEQELKFSLLPVLSVDFYLRHLDIYEQDRHWVLMLNEYLRHNRHKLDSRESLNERSFEIWGREKFLTREQGRRILKRCGLDECFLNTYSTTEPLAYYSHTREVPQKLLILENKDTFYSMRCHLLEGNDTILGTGTGTLIYGAGKGIVRSFQDFSLCVEPYMKEPENQIYYFGDLDYEGIGIYEKLADLFSAEWEIRPFLPGYKAMLDKAVPYTIMNLPKTKEQQNRNIRELFFSYFDRDTVQYMKDILEQDRYIPQEILNITDF
ncbi:MAG: DUF2220 family protein [Eubacteriales bacterium]|nr:DUF2220 family protein [Eubacteriales bacterium]